MTRGPVVRCHMLPRRQVNKVHPSTTAKEITMDARLNRVNVITRRQGGEYRPGQWG